MKKTKSIGDLILVVTLGWLGIHKFKEKKTGMGLAYMFTFVFAHSVRYKIPGYNDRFKGAYPALTVSL